MMGSTNPAEAAPGTIRGDLAIETTENLVHGSDSHESAAREIALFFPDLAPSCRGRPPARRPTLDRNSCWYVCTPVSAL